MKFNVIASIYGVLTSIFAQEPVRKMPASGPEFFSSPFLMRIVEKIVIAAG